MPRAYSVLCGIVGTAFVLLGAVFFGVSMASFAPGASSPLRFPLGPNGLYFVAFTGSTLVAWGGCLLGAARRGGGRSIGTATAVGLVLASIYRMSAWLMGDIAWAGELPRLEASLFLVLALGFVWLRPKGPATGVA
jgi:hypothetical protein